MEHAGEAWRAESDQIGRFIQEACITGECVQAKARELYVVYKDWAEDAGEQVETERVFGQRIAEKYTRKREAHGNVYLGIGLTKSR